jgi:hypothetical protein
MEHYFSLFSQIELFLAGCCPVFGAIGGVAHMLLLDFDWTKTPELEFTDKPKKEDKKLRISQISSKQRGGWYFARILLGFVAGGIIFLFVHGSITDTASAASKVLILAFFAGLSAPSLFKEMEAKYRKQILSQVDSDE